MTYGGCNTIFAAFDEDGNFAGARRFQDLSELGYSLLQNLGRANVDFGDHHHDWDV